MPATSPYSGNDYQAVSNFRPYELPINDIFKGIAAQNQFWDAGAARVKSVYDNALSLNLTLEKNKEVRDQFMKDADKQLTKLSSMDLSDPSVQRQGFAIYKPLFSDKSIIYDDAITKTRSSIIGEAQNYKSKKLSPTGAEGEGFSNKNLAFALDGFEDFNKDTPRDEKTLENLHNKLSGRTYTPSYDMTKEFTKIANLCKGSGVEKQDISPSYLYFDFTSKSGANSSETSNCFMMGLSPAAKQQINIDGWAYYKGAERPYEKLAEDHYKYSVGYSQQALDAIKGRIAAFETKGDKITEEEKLKLKSLKEALPSFQESYDKSEKEFKKMTDGNGLDYATKNFTALAGSIHANRTYHQLGEAFRDDVNKRLLKDSAAGIAEYNAYARMRLEELKSDLEKKKTTENLDIPQPLDPNFLGGDTGRNYGEQDFKNEKTLLSQTHDKAYQTLRDYIRTKSPNANVTDAFILNYANDIGKNDREFNNLNSIYRKTQQELKDKDIRGKSIDLIAESNMSTQDKEIVNKSVTLSNGKVIKIGDIQIVTTPPANDKSLSLRDRMVVAGVKTIYVEGKPITNTIDKLLVESLHNEVKGVYSKLSEKKDELHRKAHYENLGLITPRQDPDKDKESRIKLRVNTLNIPGGPNDKDGYTLIGHDRTGADVLIVPRDKDNKEVTSMEAFNVFYDRAIKIDPTVGKVQIGRGLWALQIKNVLEPLPNIPDAQELNNMNKLRDFSTLMSNLLNKDKRSYVSSSDLTLSNGQNYPLGTTSFQTPSGLTIEVVAIKSNGQIKLKPITTLEDGTKDTNHESYSTPEEIIRLYNRKKNAN